MSALDPPPLVRRSFKFPDPSSLVRAAVKVCQALHTHGHEALFAGGCVRDFLLNRPVDDIDIATSAHPEDVQHLFPSSLPIGKAFGVVLVEQDSFRFEVATFRVDSKTGDGRRPDSVVFADPKADAFRRDFTVNALFYDLRKQQILDFTGGLKDLESKRITTVGPPEERFKEDYLRMLRAIRFTHSLRFTLAPDVRQSIIQNAHLIQHLPAERIHRELETLFAETGVPGDAVKDLVETGIWYFHLERGLPEISRTPPPASHLLQSHASILNASAPAAYWEVLAYSLYSIGYPDKNLSVQAIQQLGFSKKTAAQSIELFYSLRSEGELSDLKNHQICRLANLKTFSSFKKIRRAEIHTSGQTKRLEELNAFDQRAQSFIPPPKPWIQGEDLIRVHIPEGAGRAHLIETAFRMQLNGELSNRREALDWLDQKARSE